MITEVNAPNKVFHPENFDHLWCQTHFQTILKHLPTPKPRSSWRSKLVISGVEKEIQEFDSFQSHISRLYWLAKDSSFKLTKNYKSKIVNINVSDKCYRLLSPMPEGFGKTVPEYLDVLQRLADVFDSNPHNNIIFRDLNVYNFRHAFYPKGFNYISHTDLKYQRQIESEVVQCGKTVFVAKSSEIKSEYEFLSKQYHSKKLFVSSQGKHKFPTWLDFRHPRSSRVVRRFKSIMEAGIWPRLERAEIRRKNVNRTAVMKIKQPKGVELRNIGTLGGALATVFVLVGGLLGVAILLFIVEDRSHVGGLLMGMICSESVVYRIRKNYSREDPA